ncbi:MAG: hypothetical protein KA020_02545 [Planctomycetes bacterium]|jgi:hypothetical protein|nr:hypothetical protein [Planctomycetota bacterium]
MSHLSHCLLLPLMAALFATAGPAQQTLLVGAGQPFSTITAAIQVANAGDTVLVLGGFYTESIEIGRGIRVLGQNGAALESVSNLFLPRVRFRGVPAGETAVFAGFDLRPTQPLLTSNARSLIVDQCPGTVVIAELTASGNYATWHTTMTASPQVHVRQARLGRTLLDGAVVAFDNCRLTRYEDIIPVLELRSGTALFTGGEVTGSQVVFPFQGAIAAAKVDGGMLIATRTTFRAGPATSAQFTAPAIATTGGELLLDPSVVLLPTGNVAPIQGPAAPANLELVSASAMVSATQLVVTSHGPAGAFHGIAIGPLTAPTATPYGFAWLAPASAQALAFGAFDASRLFTTTVALPPLPPGLVFALQPVLFDPLQVRLGIPTVVVSR